MILDDENIQIQNVQSHVVKERLCDSIGKLYITKSGEMGFVLNIDEQCLPKTIIKCYNHDITHDELLSLNTDLNMNNQGWFIPSKRELTNCLNDWQSDNDIDFFITKLINKSNSEQHRYNYHIRTKCQTGFISNIQGSYWMNETKECIMTIDRINNLDNPLEIRYIINIRDVLSLFRNNEITSKILYMYNIPKEQRISFEESDKIIEDQLNNLENICGYY